MNQFSPDRLEWQELQTPGKESCPIRIHGQKITQETFITSHLTEHGFFRGDKHVGLLRNGGRHREMIVLGKKERRGKRSRRPDRLDSQHGSRIIRHFRLNFPLQQDIKEPAHVSLPENHFPFHIALHAIIKSFYKLLPLPFGNSRA